MHKGIFLVTFFSFRESMSCKLHGSDIDSGVCLYSFFQSNNDDNKDAITKRWNCYDNEQCMPFCGKWIADYYSPCVPSIQKITKADRNFPQGRFHKHSTFMKDQWIKQKVEHVFEESQRSRGYFYNNEDCRKAFERYMCWVNFPRCDEDTSQSLPMCESVCKNYFKVCSYDHSLQLCSSERLNAENKFYFPGQPFVENDDKNVVCTPSVKGSSLAIFRKEVKVLTCMLSVAVSMFLN